MELLREEAIDAEINDHHPFNYYILAKINWKDPSSIVEDSNYEAFVQHAADKGFIRLQKCHKHTTDKPTLESTASEGFKVHMSIFDPSDDDNNLSKAWAIVVQTSIKYNIELIKIIRNDYRDLMRSGDKFGKEITWYAFKDNFEPDRIKEFLTALTIQFTKQGIIPGSEAIHDLHRITNSNYFTYRNDGPAKDVDPFEDITIDLENQPLRQNYNQHILKAKPPERIVMESDAISNDQEYNESLDSESKCSKCCRP